MRLKYSCEYCTYSEIQHFRNQIIGEPYLAGPDHKQTVNYACPNCGITQWNITTDFSAVESLYLGLYQWFADSLGKLGLKQYVFEKGKSVDDWLEEIDKTKLNIG